jgi:hypothetical protein
MTRGVISWWLYIKPFRVFIVWGLEMIVLSREREYCTIQIYACFTLNVFCRFSFVPFSQLSLPLPLPRSNQFGSVQIDSTLLYSMLCLFGISFTTIPTSLIIFISSSFFPRGNWNKIYSKKSYPPLFSYTLSIGIQ